MFEEKLLKCIQFGYNIFFYEPRYIIIIICESDKVFPPAITSGKAILMTIINIYTNSIKVIPFAGVFIYSSVD